jgi:Protein of unknown function (DUF4058)
MTSTIPVRSIKNQYRGVNAHLHSRWQAEGGWGDFHTPYIAALTVALKARLLPIGYTAHVEDSLQIRRADGSTRFPRADLSIYDLQPSRARSQLLPDATDTAHVLSGLVLPLVDVLDETPITEKPFRAIALYPRPSEVDARSDQPVAWIEVLSPTNKRPGDDRERYLGKRTNLLAQSIVFVEIDFLHETPPTLRRVPDYSQHDAQTARHITPPHPYRIMVFDPRPNLDEGQASINEFGVDDPIPTVIIPLNGDDQIDVDFGSVYRKLYQDMLYGLELVDYATLPTHFEHYSEADQLRIAIRMLTVLDTARRGADLEALTDPPLPNADQSLDEALARLASWQSR